MQHLCANTRLSSGSQAIFKLIPKEEQSKLAEDENTPEKRANKLWAFFEKKDNGETMTTTTTQNEPCAVLMSSHSWQRGKKKKKKNRPSCCAHILAGQITFHNQLFGLIIIQAIIKSPRATATVTASAVSCEVYYTCRRF